MHDVLTPFKQNPSQKFLKNLNNFEKSQKFSKTPKVWSKDMKCMINEWESIIPDKDDDLETEDWVRKRFGVNERGGWEGGRLESIDRDREKWSWDLADRLNKSS